MEVLGTHEFSIPPKVNTTDNIVGVHETTADPTVSNDETQGYYPGYIWIATTSGDDFLCEDASTGAAVWKNLSAGSTDADAIHKSTAAEISTVTEKTVPVAADLLLIEDSAAGNAKKRLQVGNLPGDADAIHDNVAGEIAAITEKTTPVAADKIIIEDSADSNNKKMVQLGNLPSTWRPNSVPLGSILTSGASFFINGGAGVYLSMSGAADDAFYFNDTLNKSGLDYDGSDLALVLHCRLSQSGVGGDNVGLLLDYAFIGDGDNSTTIVTNVAQVNYDVSSEILDETFDIQLTTMIGGVNTDNTIMISVTRNGTGAGADTFAGNLEIISMEFVKV